MATAAAAAVCKSKGCTEPVSNVGVANGLNYCQYHWDQYFTKNVGIKKDQWLEKTEFVRNTAAMEKLETERQWLQSEIDELNGVFDALEAKVQQWRDRAVSRMQALYHLADGALQDAAEAEISENDIRDEFATGDARRVQELTETLDFWLDEVHKRSKKFREDRLNQRTKQNNGLNVRSVGDVAGGVQQLQFMIDRHMADVMQRCWLEDQGASETKICRSVPHSVVDLPNRPCHLAPCTNTAGFACDASGRVVRADSPAASFAPLPQPCVFVAFCAGNSQGHDLLLMSLDGARRYSVHVNLTGTGAITVGLLCDSDRQLLFAAQSDALTAMDLSGQQSQTLEIHAKVQDQRVDFSGIAQNTDQLFAVDLKARKILVISKDDGDVKFTIDINTLSANPRLHGLSLSGSKLLLADFDTGLVHKICSISGSLISTLRRSTNSGLENFRGPWQVAVNVDRGIVILSEFEGHTVRLMTCDGAILQTLGTAGEIGDSEDHFNHPGGVALVESGNGSRLMLVADIGNRRLRVFEML